MTMGNDEPDMPDGGDQDDLIGDLLSGRVGSRKPNPLVDTALPLTDEQFGSRELYRYSHEANTLGRMLDSRMVDATVEFDDQQGFRYYTEQQMLVFKEEDDEGYEEITDDQGKNIKGFGVSRLLGNLVSLKSGEPLFGSQKKVARVKKLWQTCREEALKEARQAKSREKLTKEQEFQATKKAQENFLAEVKRLGLDELVEYRRGWFLTPMRLRALLQAPVKGFCMTPKPLLDDIYEEVKELKVKKAPELVNYLYVGCANDEELITFIRTDPKPWDVSHQPPAPLVKEVDWFGNPTYKIPRHAEDERGMTLRAHMAAQKEVQTAEEVYDWEQRTKERTGYYNHPLFAALPPQVELDDEEILSWAAQEVKAGRASKKQAQDLAAKLRDHYENWLTKCWDRWLPNECYSYRNQFFDSVAYFDPSDWSTVADRIADVNKLQIHVITPPTVVGVYPNIMTDWRPFRDYVAPVQARRWVVELWNHWKMTKNMHNNRASEDLEGSDIKNARRNSHGGPETEERYARDDWRFNKLSEAAGDDPERRLHLLGPLWSKKQLWQPIDHAGALASKYTRKWNSLLDGLGKIRGLASMANGKAFPEIDQLRDKFTTQVRGYESEYHWMLNDEYTNMDPYDAWKNQSGILTYSLLDEANLRLDSAFAHVPGLRLAYSTSATGRAFTNLSGFIEEMWCNLPPWPIVLKVEEKIASWKHHNVAHLRPKIDELLKGVHRSSGRFGLNKYFTGFYQRKGQQDRLLDGKLKPGQQYRDLQLINRLPIMDSSNRLVREAFEREWEWVPGWYEQSDQRIHERVYWWCEAGSDAGRGRASGAGGFDIKMATDLNKEGYGLGYGSLGEQQERQERLSWVGLWAGYFNTIKHFLQWFDTRRKSVEITPDFDDEGVRPNKTWVTLNEIKLKVAGLVDQGKLLHFIARDELWPRLRMMDPQLINEPYPFGHEVIDRVDDEFVIQILDYMVGSDSRPTRKDILLGKKHKEEVLPILAENHEHYARVVEARFFGTNHHHSVFN